MRPFTYRYIGYLLLLLLIFYIFFNKRIYLVTFLVFHLKKKQHYFNKL